MLKVIVFDTDSGESDGFSTDALVALWTDGDFANASIYPGDISYEMKCDFVIGAYYALLDDMYGKGKGELFESIDEKYAKRGLKKTIEDLLEHLD